MTEADVTYADVKFNKSRARENVASEESTYSEVKISNKHPPVSANCAENIQPPGSSKRSKVTSERLVLLVLIGLLVASLAALGVTYETCLKCGAGWELHGGTCYKFNTNKSSWTESRDSCQDLGGDLVKIDGREEQMFLEEKLRGLMEEAEDKFWIGLTDSELEGRWLWVDGSPLDESLKFWWNKEPDDWKGQNPAGEDCGRMGEKGGASDLKCWFDRSCNDPHKSICEKTAVSGQTSCVCV
ncbi:CD209 antigen-like protein E [Fundulus heteroclitus]|uniref:CD209 antigen-like protein E n=1 Tax=Fundulus heteroclitus TaxID=8078 RepID=UPI00165C7E29|nr:CD209 antigen-like protein E [Fundulus heteroclitus]